MTKDELLKIIMEEGEHYKDTYNNIQFELIRNQLGTWCGYVDIPNHILVSYKLSNKDILNCILCHGGITFEEQHGDYLRIGFDCCHYNDLSFSNLHFNSTIIEYKTKTFAINECKSIIEQLLRK